MSTFNLPQVKSRGGSVGAGITIYILLQLVRVVSRMRLVPSVAYRRPFGRLAETRGGSTIPRTQPLVQRPDERQKVTGLRPVHW